MITLGDKVFLKFDNERQLCRTRGHPYLYQSMENAIKNTTQYERNMGYIIMEYRPVLHCRWIQVGVNCQGNTLFECNVCHKVSVGSGCFCSCCGSEMDMGPDEVVE